MKLSRRNLKLEVSGDDVRLLQSELIQLGLPIPQSEQARGAFLEGTYQAVVRFQRDHKLKPDGVVNAETARVINKEVSVLGKPIGGPERAANVGDHTVAGTVSSPDRAGVDGLTVAIVDKSAGKEDVTLARSTTGPGGYFETTISAAAIKRLEKPQPDLQARVSAGDVFLAASDVVYNATSPVTLNTLLPPNCTALCSEWESLMAAVAVYFPGALSTLQEDANRQDITYLANKTGWDARAIALAVLADQFSGPAAPQEPGKRPKPTPAAPRIAAPFYYALFRAGFLADPERIHLAAPDKVESIWQSAVAQGVIPKNLEADIPQALAALQQLAAASVLRVTAVPGTSTLQDLLRPTLGDDVAKQQQFAALHNTYAADPARLWQETERAFGTPTANRLRLDGQLASLTLNNAPLVAALHNASKDQRPITSTLDLVSRGLYDAKAWLPLLAATPLPDTIPGDTPEQRRANYAEVMAAQVRLVHPTAVVAQQVQAGTFSLRVAPDKAAPIRSEVAGFLGTHQAEFVIGLEPVERYIARKNLGKTISSDALDQLKRLQRVYQITPHDNAMTGLLERDMDSAFRIARCTADDFVARHGAAVGGEQTARLIHAKARQVHHTVVGIALSYLAAQRAPAIGRHSPTGLIDPGSKGSGVVGSATLEMMQLAGDYCRCEDCRSILSPAAYLVDLLDFLNVVPDDGKSTNPRAVLFKRRPDIQYLPLTCEHTNIALPYIDPVLETLEYFVVNANSLDNYAGHHTDRSVTSAELLASPQFVNDLAYQKLTAVYFPPPLPFNQPLEALRRYLDHFDTPLHAVLQTFRKDEQPQTWTDIRLERLGISPQELMALTDSKNVPIALLAGFPGANDVPDRLTSVHDFTRRFNLEYDDLVAMLKTTFVNPDSGLIPRLEQLGLPFTTLKALAQDKTTPITLPAGLDPVQFGGQSGDDPVATVATWVAQNYPAIAGLITIALPGGDDPCNPGKFTFRYADPDKANQPLREVALLRLIRFIRLWRKLGWTVNQTDQAIVAFAPNLAKTPDPDDAKAVKDLDDGFIRVLPRLGVALAVMDRLHLDVAADLPSLLACWADIGTASVSSLYRALFLHAAEADADPAFAESSVGDVLQDNKAKLLQYLDTLRAAFNLTGDELDRITDQLGMDANTALSIANISAVYRHGWLARKLKISVREFLLLTDALQLDPFADPDPAQQQVLGLLDVVDDLRATGLAPTQALYRIWNQDLSGKSAPPDDQITSLARSVRSACASVDTAFAIADDPSGELARSRLALVYGKDVSDRFVGLLVGSVQFSVSYDLGAPTLDASIVAKSGGRLAYNDFHKTLSFGGALVDPMLTDLKTLPAAQAHAGFAGKLDDLAAAGTAASKDLLDRYPDLKPAYQAFKGDLASLLTLLLPALSSKRKIQETLAAVGSSASADPVFTAAVLADAEVMPSTDDPKVAAISDFVVVADPGLAAKVWWTGGGKPDATSAAEGKLDYADTSALPGNPAKGTKSNVVLSGFLEVPDNDDYAFAVDAGGASSVTLAIDGADVALNTAVTLAAGRLYEIAITIKDLTGALKVSWTSPTRGQEVIPPPFLYSATRVDVLRMPFVRFLKTSALARDLKLTPAEFGWLAKSGPLQINAKPWVNALPSDGPAASQLNAPLAKVLVALLDFARTKATQSPKDERLLQALEALEAKPANHGPLLALTRWNQGSFTAALAHFGLTDDKLTDLGTLRRVSEALHQAAALGVPVGVLTTAASNNPQVADVAKLKAAVRARYAQSDWLDVLRPISDELRGLQRDALVAYVLQALGQQPKTADIDTPDKLFEYFLMDVEMEPCAQTSRIRHALSSVQLFIERCLLNIEADVQLGALPADRWVWMRRYRVWQAQREIMMWPHHWLDIGVRKEASPIFQQTMTKLLHGDITDDAAAAALQEYLSQLEEIAKLEPCGMYCDEASGVVHVVACTTGAHRKYFHCSYDGVGFSAFHPIKLEIEGFPVAPVVAFGNRLMLFWLRIQQHTPKKATKPSGTGPKLDDITPNPPGDIDVKAVLCWSEYYNGVWQPTKTSPADTPVDLGLSYSSADDADQPPFSRNDLRLAFVVGDALQIIIEHNNAGHAAFTMYTTHSTPVQKKLTAAEQVGPLRQFDDSRSDQLAIRYYSITDRSNAVETLPVLSELTPMPISAIEPLQEAKSPWELPFLMNDARYAFYVESKIGGPVTEPANTGMGMIAANRGAEYEPPGLVLPGPSASQRVPFTGRGPGFGVTDPAPMRTFLSSDAYIKRGLATGGTVKFGTQSVGPAGSVPMQGGLP